MSEEKLLCENTPAHAPLNPRASATMTRRSDVRAAGCAVYILPRGGVRSSFRHWRADSIVRPRAPWELPSTTLSMRWRGLARCCEFALAKRAGHLAFRRPLSETLTPSRSFLALI
eukprot:3083581-Prymnesium_polylepis.1